MNRYLAILYLTFIIACTNNKTSTTNNKNIVVNDTLEAAYKKTYVVELEDRVKSFLDSILLNNKVALAAYSPWCWIDDCSARGFVYIKKTNKIELIIFRLKRIYQRKATGDSVAFVGIVFECRNSNYTDPSINLMGALNELEQKNVPIILEGGQVDHDSPVKILYKVGDSVLEARTWWSTLHSRNRPLYDNTVTLFRKTDSLASEVFTGTNNDTLAVNGDIKISKGR